MNFFVILCSKVVQNKLFQDLVYYFFAGTSTLSISDVYDKLATLVKNHFICRCPNTSVLRLDESTSDTVTSSKSSNKHIYDVPKIDISGLLITHLLLRVTQMLTHTIKDRQ